MPTSSPRSRALFGCVLSFSLVAPLSGVLDSAVPAGAASAHTVRPFLALSPHTFPPPVATYTVTTTSDTADTHPGDGICADSANQCSIRAAIEEANADGVTANINVPAGSYALTMGALTPSDPGGIQLIGAGAGTTVIAATPGDDTMDVVQTADGSGSFVQVTNLTLQGNGHSVMDIKDGNDTAILSGSTVIGGTAGSGGGVFNEGQLWATDTAFTSDTATGDNGTSDVGGGAIYNDDGSIRLNGDSFTGNAASDNSASSGGGAIDNVDGPVAIDNSSFIADSTRNSSSNAEGGALFIDDETELTDDTFTGNSATGMGPHDAGFGGAVYSEYGLNQVSGATFAGNSVSSQESDTEGGAFFDGSTACCAGGGGATITQSTFVDNVANDGEGGGLSDEGPGMTLSADAFSGNSATGTGDEGFGGAVYSADAATITATQIAGNHAESGGGGIYVDDGVVLDDSRISTNTANLGAGVYADWNVQATSDAIVDNVASGPSNAGGGLYLPTNGGTASRNNRLDFLGVTVAGNVSGTGAGIALEGGGATPGSGTLTNSTVADNRTPGGAEQDCAVVGTATAHPIASAGGNVVGDLSCGFRTNSDRQGASNQGYWETASDGGLFTFNTGFFGSMGGKPLNKPIVGMAHTPGNQGYWEVASDGGVFSFGDASFFGSTGGKSLNAPVVGVAATPDGQGYWEVASDGGVFSFGDASFFGSMGGQHLNEPMVGLAVTPDGQGYWEVASDGGVFSFGDASFFGSMGGQRLNKPIVGIAAAVDGAGYDEVASDGGVFNFGSAGFFGSAGSLHLNAPVVGIAAAPDNTGYWTFAADGGVFDYGTGAQFKGSAGSLRLVMPVVGGSGT